MDYTSKRTVCQVPKAKFADFLFRPASPQSAVDEKPAENTGNALGWGIQFTTQQIAGFSASPTALIQSVSYSRSTSLSAAWKR